MAVVCYFGVGVCKWALLWVVAAVLMALVNLVEYDLMSQHQVILYPYFSRDAILVI